MSETEKFWDAMAAKFGNQRKWSQLNAQEQQQVIMGINLILAVVSR